MARKDVDLVIRAKDEAAKVVNSITKALNEFVEAQSTLDTRAKKTESSLTQLGAAIGGLDKTLGGLDVGRKLTQELDKAAGALSRIEAEVEGTQQAVSKLSREFANSEAITARYASKLEGATAALERQKASVAKARAEQKALTAAYDESVAAQSKIAARQATLPGLIEKQSAAIAKTKARYAELSDELESTTKPSRTLQENFEATSRSLTKQETKLSELRQEYSATEGKLRAAGSAAAIFAGQSAAAASSLTKQERALAKISQNYAELGVKTKAASGNLKTIEGSLAAATGKLNAQSASLDAAEADFVDLALAAGQADRALEALSKQSIGNLQGELDRQRRAMLEAKREYLGLTDASSKLAAEIGKAGVPTRQMAEDFARTKVEAAGAKAEYSSQRETLARMGQAFRETGTDVESLRSTQARFTELQRNQGVALEAGAAKVRAQTAEIRKLFGATNAAAQAAQKLGSATRQGANDAQRNASATSAQAAAYRKLYGDTRTTLDLTQRLRGQVLSMIAAYGGLYGVISLLGQVVSAYQTLEAAQARLNVANSGDVVQTADDMDFLRRTADRLGVELGTLSQEYSKFAIATKGTNLEGDKTRKIFLSVAEAARVNRSSNEELSGVFVALTQIVSKGAVQMEELRQQLGDRLPGALQIMADGLNVTTAELIKMMEQGQVTSDALVPFAEELDKRFGPGLGEALAGTTVALGRLKNAAFQALVEFGKGGFIDAFTNLANDLTDLLQSADFQTFTANASAAFAVVIDAIAFMARNFDLFVASLGALSGLLGVKILAKLAVSFGLVGTAAGAAGAASAAAAGGIGAAGAAAAGAAGGVTLLGRALAFLMSSTGIGLAVAVIGAGIALWASQADIATEALTEHKRILDLVKNAYDETGGSVEKWKTAVETFTAIEAKNNLDALTKALEKTKSEFTGMAGVLRKNIFGTIGLGESAGVRQYLEQVGKLFDEFEAGERDAQSLRNEVDKLTTANREAVPAIGKHATEIDAVLKKLVEQSEAVEQARQILLTKIGTDEEAAAALEVLAGAAEETGKAFDQKANAAVGRFTETMEKLQEFLPKATSEMDKLAEEVGKIETAFDAALTAARAMPDAIMRIAAEQQALATANAAIMAATQASVDGQFGNFTNGAEAAAALIRDREGFRPDPYWDVNAYRTGFGSDTVTLDDGSVKKVVLGMTTTVADANRDLLRRINTEFMPAAARGSGGRFDSFTAQQQAALTSIAYNYGSLPDRLAKVIQGGGTTKEIADAIRALGSDNAGVNRGRRNEEAALFESTAGVEAAAALQVRTDEERRRTAEREAEEREAKRAATQEAIADGEFEIAQQERVNAGKERQAAIEAAIREAKAGDPNITQAEIDKIAEQTGKLFDLAEIQKNTTTDKEKAAEAEEKVNDLLGLRTALVQQLEMAKESGDTELQEELRAKIAEVNAELVAAIENAQAMWGAVGGSAGDAAIAKLQSAKLEAQNFSQQAQKNYLDWSRVSDLFVNGLSSAFDRFSQAVAEGQSVGEAARDAFLQFAGDFLREIAQMIIKQAIFNALKGAFGGTGFGSLIGLGHTGGIVGSKRVGSGNSTRRIDPGMFAGAPRYHSGGVIGLRPGEVPIIAKQGEEMLTEDDPFHSKNRGSLLPQPSGGGETNLRVVNGIDSASFLEAALNTAVGEKVLLNWLRANADAVSSSRG